MDEFPGLSRVGPGGLMPAMTVTFVMHPQWRGLEGIGQGNDACLMRTGMPRSITQFRF